MVRCSLLGRTPLVWSMLLALQVSAAAAQDSYFDEDASTPPSPTYASGSDEADAVQPREIDLGDLQPAGDADSVGANGAKVEVIKERYPNGSTRIEREVTQDANDNYINHGSWKMYDAAGTLIAEGRYENGERTGTWNRWYRGKESKLFAEAPYLQFRGPFISQATFENGRLDGAWTIYDAKQHIISKWEFVDGQRNGVGTWYYPNGRKLREIAYRDGDMDGDFLQWNPDGSLAEKVSYQLGRKLAPKTEYHQGTQRKKSEGMYLYRKDIIKVADDWWNCQPAQYTKHGKDERHGRWVSWHENGAKEMEGEFKSDLQVGKFTWWHANGQKMSEGYYEEGKMVGRWIWWHPNGQKRNEGEYVDGAPSGRWTWWETDGRVAQRADFSHGDSRVVERPRSTSPRPTTSRLRPSR
ncbi:MAG: toxin-antitoxin system YwqK family antitoxin [Pirellulales bacterium]